MKDELPVTIIYKCKTCNTQLYGYEIPYHTCILPNISEVARYIISSDRNAG